LAGLEPSISVTGTPIALARQHLGKVEIQTLEIAVSRLGPEQRRDPRKVTVKSRSEKSDHAKVMGPAKKRENEGIVRGKTHRRRQKRGNRTEPKGKTPPQTVSRTSVWACE
jgi:hypothetical protein